MAKPSAGGRTPWGVAWALLLGLSACGRTPSPRGAQPASGAPGVPALPREGITQTRIREPIFGSQMFVVEAGRGQRDTVLLVHGVGALGSRIWNGVLPALAARYHVIALDLPGFGRSERANRLYSPARLAAAVHAAVRRLARGPIVLVGHSLGGAVSLHYAAAYPETLRRLVLVDVAGILHRLLLPHYLASLRTDARWGRIAPRLFSQPLGAVQGIVTRSLSLVERRPVARTLRGLLGHAWFRKRVLGGNPNVVAGLALMTANYGPVIDRVRAPTTFLWGSRDRVAPLRTGRVLRALIAGARLEVIPGAGHNPMLERRERFTRLLLRAVAGAAAAPRSGAPLPAAAPSKASPTVAPAAPARPRPLRHGHCRGRSDVTFRGRYASIRLERCVRARLQDVEAARVEATGSELVIEGGRIGGAAAAPALRLDSSYAVVTGTVLAGEPPLSARRSRADLAGVTLRPRGDALRARAGSWLLLSVCRVLRTPGAPVYLHGIYEQSVAGPKTR